MKPQTAKRGSSALDPHSISALNAGHAACPPALMRGICADAMVVTMAGMRKVQTLRPGDALVTRSTGAARLVRVEQACIVTRAIYVIAGSLGHYQVDRDTILPAQQTVHVRDWRAPFIGGSDTMLVSARDLVDGEYVRDIGHMPLTVYRLFCEEPAVIYADGMELGTSDTQATTTLPAPFV